MSWNHTELQSSRQSNTSASYNFSNIVQKPIEIYVFIDPLCPECWSLEPYLKKLSIEYGHYFTIRAIINGHLSSLSKEPFDYPKRLHDMWERTAQRTGMPYDDFSDGNPTLSPWITCVAIKAAELQGKNAGRSFLRKVQENLFLNKKNISEKNVLIKCAEEAQLDVEEFKSDLNSATAKKALRCDLKLTYEMNVDYTPTIVFLNHFSDEQGIKISGLYPYHIYVLVLSKILQKKPTPSEKPSLEEFIAKYNIVATKEVSVVYDWTMSEAEFELKKLQLKQVVKKVNVKYGAFWKYLHHTAT